MKPWLLLFGIFAVKLVTAEPSRSETNCVCGNGIQETLPASIAPCPYRLYGTTTLGPTSVSNLIYLNPYDGTGSVIAPISGAIRAVTGLDFSPTGILYAVGRNLSNQSVLATINCETGAATTIGLTNAPGTGVTGINFDSQGRLWAHTSGTTAGVRQDGLLGRLNIATGEWTLVGNTHVNDIGNGIAFGGFPNSTLYHAGYLNLNILNQSTGEAMSVSQLIFSDPAVNRPRINDMDFDAAHNIMYAAINDKPSGQSSPNINYLGSINLATGDVIFTKIPPRLAPEGLSALAVNRPYETCDQGGVPENIPPIPEGTACTELCVLTELICTDGQDNDANGLADCLDPACDGQTCLAGDGCTEDFCASSICQIGPPKSCDDFIECTTDTCSFGLCSNELAAGNPCNDFNPCTENDQCDVDGNCFIANPLPNGTTCDDESPCTINDACVDSQCIGDQAPEICDNGEDDNCDGLTDGDDPECAGAVTIEDICDDFEDNDGDFLIDCDDPDCDGLSCAEDDEPCTDQICQFFSCTPIPDDTNTCDDNVECTDDSCSGGICVGTNDDSNLCSDNDLCTENDGCNAGICVGTAIICDDDNECTTDFCIAGECSIAPLTGTNCTSDYNPCTDDVCNEGKCTHVNDNTNICSDGIACTINDACVSGTCVGSPGTETGIRCSNGIDDDCDFLIDSLDPNCASTLWLRVFVTSAKFKPTWGDVTNADTLCQSAAVAAARTGNFKAFVSSSTSNAATRITNPNNKPWYMYTNAPNRIADNKADLLDGTIQQAINVTEFGLDVGNPKFTWTGSSADGTSNGFTCNDWSTDKAKVKGTRGATDKTDQKWVNQPDATCNQQYRLYCFQVE